MNITGRIRVFATLKDAKDGTSFWTYSTTISDKTLDGGFVNMALDVQFGKKVYWPGEKHQDEFYIFEVSKAWLTCRGWKNANEQECRRMILRIDEAQLVEVGHKVGTDIRENTRDANMLEDKAEIDDSDMPF